MALFINTTADQLHAGDRIVANGESIWTVDDIRYGTDVMEIHFTDGTPGWWANTYTHNHEFQKLPVDTQYICTECSTAFFGVFTMHRHISRSGHIARDIAGNTFEAPAFEDESISDTE